MQMLLLTKKHCSVCLFRLVGGKFIFNESYKRQLSKLVYMHTHTQFDFSENSSIITS